MNYLETGLPHQDLFQRKSDFKPPRYKPLCSLGRRYLGLDPMSKSEQDSINNRLCKPKKAPEPEDPSNFTRKVRPTIFGTGRFCGRKRMTGNQISKMVDRLAKRKTETNTDEKDNTKGNRTATENTEDQLDNDPVEEENAIPTDGQDMPNASPRRVSRSSARQRNVHFERRESTVAHSKDDDQFLEIAKTQERNTPMNDNTSSIKHDNVNIAHPAGGLNSNASEKEPKQKHAEERYESLYYRGVKTEIARKAFNQNKRSSVHMIRLNKVDNIKSAKTDLSSAPHQHSRLEDMHNRRPRVKTS